MVSLFEEHRQEIAEIIAREKGLPATQADDAACWTLDHALEDVRSKDVPGSRRHR